MVGDSTGFVDKFGNEIHEGDTVVLDNMRFYVESFDTNQHVLRLIEEKGALGVIRINLAAVSNTAMTVVETDGWR